MATVEQIKLKRAGVGLPASEGDFGRFFEVTRDGELVWEYVNPYFGEGPTGPNNRVFRCYRYSEEEIARAKAGV